MNRLTVVALAVFCASISNGAVRGLHDASVADFPRLAGETDDAPRFRRAIESIPNGVLAVPKGDYKIGSMLTVTNRCSLDMHPAARLVAVAKMPYVLFWDGSSNYHALSVFDGDGEVYDNAGLFIRGGDVDGRGLASCLAIANSHHFTLRDITLHNGLRTGLCVTRESSGHLYELIANNVYCKCTMPGLAGNVGIECQCGDSHFTDCIVVDYTVSIRDCGSGANRYTRCHVWGGTVPPKGMSFKAWSDYYTELKKKKVLTPELEKDLLSKGVPEMLVGSIGFDVSSWGNVFDGCYADTAEIGFRVTHGATILSSGFYNNARMGLRKSTAIVHKGGPLSVINCRFCGAAKVEKLYEGDGKNLVWRNVSASAGDGMEAQNKVLSGAK